MLFGKKRREREEAERREREAQERKRREAEAAKKMAEEVKRQAEQELKAKQKAEQERKEKAAKLAEAQPMYDLLCKALDEWNWHYQKDEEKSLVHFRVNGDSIPVNMFMFIDSDRKLIRVLSPLSFEMSEDKRLEGALAVAHASYGMTDGSFDYDFADGQISFRMAHTYRDCRMETAAIDYMIDCSVAMVDKYSAKFLALNKGLLSLEDFLKEE